MSGGTQEIARIAGFAAALGAAVAAGRSALRPPAEAEESAASSRPALLAPAPACDAAIQLPDGFCAGLFADGLPGPRHLAVRPDGDVLVAAQGRGGRRGGGAATPGGVFVLRDADGDGRADVQERFGPSGGHGILLRGDTVYFAPNDAVLRYRLPAGALRPAAGPDTIVKDLPYQRSHPTKTPVIGGDGALYVGIGSPSNVCSQGRGVGASQPDPCPELETRAGIWRFDASRLGQTQTDGERFATGIRNPVAITTHPRTGEVYALQHGRDQLQRFSQWFDAERGAENPSEELLHVQRGDDFGWPYCYHDGGHERKTLAPEYGGDGEVEGRCASVQEPIAHYPGHWAPNGIVFYDADQFPASYRGGAFIAFHGSWNRAPLPQEGFRVVFQPFSNGSPGGEYMNFAMGFQDIDARPVGVAVGPDGSLFVSDDATGKIWRIRYTAGR